MCQKYGSNLQKELPTLFLDYCRKTELFYLEKKIGYLKFVIFDATFTSSFAFWQKLLHIVFRLALIEMDQNCL